MPGKDQEKYLSTALRSASTTLVNVRLILNEREINRLLLLINNDPATAETRDRLTAALVSVGVFPLKQTVVGVEGNTIYYLRYRGVR
jgi:hypothetical protein